MKILLLTPSLNLGGVETGTVDLSRSLKKLGEDVIVVSSGGRLVKELEESGIKHIRLPIHKKSISAFFQVPKLVRIIKQENIDIVHAQSRMPAWIAYFASKKTGTAFVTSCHGYYSLHFFSQIMGWGRKVIVISQVISRHMQEQFAVSQEKIRLVYRGVDLSRYNYRNPRNKLPGENFRIVNISRITPIKGHLEFIKAIGIVKKQLPNIEVWLVGSADKKKINYQASLYKLVKELDLEGCVKFLGSRSDIAQILSDCDLLVLSTQVPEAFGRVIIEAGAVGVPVCASRIGGINEIIEDGKDGILFNCGDANSMAQAMVKMLNSPELLRQCSDNLRKKVQDKFSLERMVRQTLEVYKQALDEKNILVIKLGGLGDLILATPSLKMLRQKFPKARISLLIDSNFESIVRNCPYVDDIILFDRKKKRFLGLVNELKRRGFDLSVDFKNNSLTHWLAYLAKIPFRCGFSKGLSGFLVNFSQPLPKQPAEEPVKQQFRILKKLGISSFDETLELWPDKNDDDFIANILNERGVFKADKLIGFSISASKQWPTKNWPIENFSLLCEKLIAQGLKVVIIADKYSKDKAEKFPKGKGVINLSGDTNLNQLVSLIKRLDVLVTGDSAPMHIAAAVGTRIIALFGPTDPKRHIPPAKDIKVFFKGINCQPCYKRTCTNEEKSACLDKISPEEVFNQIRQVIQF